MRQEYSRNLPSYQQSDHRQSLANVIHMDPPLLTALLLLAGFGLFILYSASGQDLATLERQAVRMTIGFTGMFLIAQLSPRSYQFWAPWLYGIGALLLVAVLLFGTKAMGAQRWLTIPGLGRFQPSEFMKLFMPLMIAWYLCKKNAAPRGKVLLLSTIILLIPTLLIAKQPDLGTALLVASSGGFVLLMAGLSGRLISGLVITSLPGAWLAFHYLLHDYQRQRVITLLNPESDPLGAGWNIIQSKIAIGSGGMTGKGWLTGTQSQLDFLPESSTDFIIAVLAEELGLIGVLFLLCLYLFIVGRGLFIAMQAQDSFSRLLAASITLTFFVYVFVNIGMVSGILPVVGVPLPLVSYGGTSIVTLLSGFGLVMSVQTHRRFM